MKTSESTARRHKPAHWVIALAYVIGIVLIVGWSLPDGAAAGRAAEGAPRVPERRAAEPPASSSKAVPDAGRTASRTGSSCAGCGVIESVQRIDTPIVVMAACHAGESAEIHGRFVNVAGPDDQDSLASTVASVIANAGGRGDKRVTVSSRHRIVVRFRDGSTQVFDEATPRSLYVGERILVIAGSVRSRTDG